jgi:hypothetical protein
MTAGKGIMHAEMPRLNPDGSHNAGMQLWVDLPAKLKACEPRYRDLKASEIPTINIDSDLVTIKIISGRSHGTESVKELAYTPVWILDIEVKPGGKVSQELPEGWNAFAYTLEGTAAFGVGKEKMSVGPFHNVVFEQNGDEVFAEVEKGAKESARFSKFGYVSFLKSSLRRFLHDFLTMILHFETLKTPSDPLDSAPLVNSSLKKSLFKKGKSSPPGQVSLTGTIFLKYQQNHRSKSQRINSHAFAGNRTRGPSKVIFRRWQRWILPLNHKRFCLIC